MWQTRLTRAAALILAAFFILSGIGKLLDVQSFQATLQAYGLGPFAAVGAVALPPLEIIIGMLLAARPGSRLLAISATGLLAVFTAGFVIAHFFAGVQDCGCFGKIAALQSSPTVSILRNVVLLGLTAYLWKNSDRRLRLSLPGWKWSVLATIGAVAFSLSGASSVEPLYQPSNPFLNQKVEQTQLAEVVTIPDDSPYLIFIYSATCGSCWDAAENVKAYKRLGVVSDIFGLTYGDEGDLMVFEDSFEPNFQSRILDRETVEQLVDETPTVFFVQNGVVRHVQKGRVMSAVRFTEDGLMAAGE